MTIRLLGVTLALLYSSASFAQHLSHPIRLAGDEPAGRISSTIAQFPDTLHILAVMVDFRRDSSALTTGDGTFNLSTTPQRIVDPPPHDSAYFADHLLFARNYFLRASGGKQAVAFTVLGEPIVLPGQMKDYNTLNSNAPLGKLVVDAWSAADSVFAEVPFDRYDLFVIFHAGSGKDVDLRGSLGYDPTPYDLPSLYLGYGALRAIFGASFQGVPLPHHPSVRVTNSAILPETDSRILPTVSGDFLFQLGINGIVVANIASHLGLPDLFDTKSGNTAIGRFGLMDGQSIFSFSGLFPPLPSAWERAFLGWTVPITVPPGSTSLRLPAAGLYSGIGSVDTVYRVPISAKEYFLVENRNRDHGGDGQTLTIRRGGQIVRRFFANDTDGFNAFAVDSAYGDVIDVEDLDWSLPGVEGYPGGILIWHIDEKIIDATIATNSINADPDHRGVDLEEADGSQDLGQAYSFTDAGSGSEDGTPLDFWFDGNLAPAFHDVFNESSIPNSLSNSYAHSHVAIRNFSRPGPVMTFETVVGDSTVTLARLIKRAGIGLGLNDTPLVADLNGDGVPELIYTAGDSVFALKNDLTPFLANGSGLFAAKGGKFQPLIAPGFLNGSGRPLVAAEDSVLYLYSSVDANTDRTADTLMTVRLPSRVSGPAMYADVTGRPSLIVPLVDSSIVSVTYDGLLHLQRTVVAGGAVVSIAGVDTDLVLVGAHELSWTGGSISLESGVGVLAAGFAELQSRSSDLYGAIVATDGSLRIFNLSGGTRVVRSLPLAGTSLAFADLEGDGSYEVLAGSGNALYAFNRTGVIADRFPFKVPDGGNIVGGTAVVHAASSGGSAILFGSSAGSVYAISGSGSVLPGFPIETGGIASTPVLFGRYLVAASTDSSLYFWDLHGLLDTASETWGNFLGDQYHSNFLPNDHASVQRFAGFLPADRAYNWPNPVYSQTTAIRYYLSKPATVEIKIFNMAGELVGQLQGPGEGNLDNEVTWDVSRIQSGVYFAEVKATAGGDEKSVVIKIAVVK